MLNACHASEGAYRKQIHALKIHFACFHHFCLMQQKCKAYVVKQNAPPESKFML